MRTPADRHRQALTQGIVLAVLLVASAAAAFTVSQRPSGRDEVRNCVSDLRSQAAELDVMLAQSGQGRITARFLRAHARQLGDDIVASHGELVGMKVEPPFLPLRDAAAPLAGQLVAAVAPLQERDPPPASRDQARRSFQGLLAIEASSGQ